MTWPDYPSHPSNQPAGGIDVLDKLDEDLPEVEDLVILIGGKLAIPVVERGWVEGEGLTYFWRGEKEGPISPQPPRAMDWAVMHDGTPLATGRVHMGWPSFSADEKLGVRVAASLP